MFNLDGGEIILILIVALIILGPEKLPDAIRRAGQAYAQFKRMSTGFQSELRSALDEPMREIRQTVDMAKGMFDEPIEEVRKTADDMHQAAKGVTDIFAGKTTSFGPPPTKPDVDPVIAAERELRLEDVATEGEADWDGTEEDDIEPYVDADVEYDLDEADLDEADLTELDAGTGSAAEHESADEAESAAAELGVETESTDEAEAAAAEESVPDEVAADADAEMTQSTDGQGA